MKITLTIEMTVDPLQKEEQELSSRELKNISGAVKRIVQHRLLGLVGVEMGSAHQLEWSSKMTAVSVALQTKA